MKAICLLVTVMMTGAAAAVAQQEPAVRISDLSLEGEIEEENIAFTLSFEADVMGGRGEVALVRGDAAYLDGKFPRGAELTREGDTYVLKLGSGGRLFGLGSGRRAVTFRFASRAVKDGDWRQTTFSVPVASVRELSLVCDRDDLEVQVPGALSLDRRKTEDGRAVVTAYLGVSPQFTVRWKPEVRKLEGELVVACDANSIATAGVGALRLDTIFTYRVIQGALQRLILDLPDDLNVTQVRGDGIQDWSIERAQDGHPRLTVMLSRPREDLYRLQVESELVLPEFPCRFNLPVLAPRDVIRASGFLMIGSDGAIRLQVRRAGGLTQVELGAFPDVTLEAGSGRARPKPTRAAYAYQYANMPYTVELSADDIVTSCDADHRLVLTLGDNELVLDASMELGIKDAPAREIVIETDPDPAWTVTSVTGRQVSEPDTDVRTEDGRRVIYIPFAQAVSGTVLIHVRMERTLAPDAVAFDVPAFAVRDARTERGYLVVAAEKGLRLKATEFAGLREVHTGSAPMRVPGAQQAFRFKEAAWSARVGIERTTPSVHAEVFHLVSLGEGVLYGSAAVTYHVAGAPVQEFLVRVPAEIETCDFVGADIEGWTRRDDLCRVRLQTRVLGDYTLLVTYDRQYAYDGDEIAVGDIETVGTESEVGYVALASSMSLKVRESGSLPESMFAVSRDEIPAAYSASVADPILCAYKYVRVPHRALLRVEPLGTERLLGQVADYVRLSTVLSRDGECVTTASYYIKNASRQYLVATLPKHAALWSVRIVDDDGNMTDVPSQESEEGILIPVRRPPDPNTPIWLELVFAASYGDLGFWRSGLKGLTLRAPRLPETHATFVKWEVTVPERFTVAYADGKRPTGCGPRAGLAGVLRTAWGCWRAVCDGWGRRTLAGALLRGWGGPVSTGVIRTLDLADSTPPALRLQVVPAWVGCGGSARGMAAGIAAGIVLTAAGSRRKRRAAVLALGLTLLAVGLSQAAVGQSAMGAVVALAVALLILLYLVRSGFRTIGSWAGRILRGIVRIVRRLSAARRARRMARADGLSPFEPDTPEENPAPRNGGWVSAGLLWLLLAAGLAVCAVRAAAGETRTPVVDSVRISVAGPATDRDVEQSAAVSAVLVFESEGPVSFAILPATAVLTDFETGSRDVDIVAGPEGYTLNVKREGRHQVSLRYRVPVTAGDGRWTLRLALPENLRNKVELTLPEPGLEIVCDSAVWFKSSERGQTTVAEAVLGPAPEAEFVWRPKVRATKLEEAVYFCDVNTLVSLRAGVVDLTSVVRYQIARGELKEVKLFTPADMNITAVRAPGLATWSFDPESHVLHAILDRPVSGEFALTVVAQVPREGLPYRVTLGALRVAGASRQRGALALAAPDTVQVRVGETTGLNPMNIEDFSLPASGDAGAQGTGAGSARTVRRAFRYHEVETVAVTVDADQVLPELRVEETGTLSVADERIVLATRLGLAIAKAGVFSLKLMIPADYDVETLTGPDVSHWDEDTALAAATEPSDEAPAEDPDAGAEGVPEAGRVVTVHFTRKVADATEINLVIARTEKGIEERIEVPRVRVEDAAKHTGRLTVSGERGVRIMVDRQRGVDLKKASEEGIRQAGVLVFDLLRPNWFIVLKTDVLSPQVKPEVLQWVDLTEGMLQCRVYLRYKIENAGVKTFLLRAPVPGITLSVTGRNIARVHEVDTETGLWQVDLHSKAENGLDMTVTYQVPYDPAERGVEILPLRTVDTEPQRGYLVVTCAGRVQVQPTGSLAGLKVEDPRNIPAVFGAGDLSGAIQCYRTLRPDYRLGLSVIRHGSADVLPATIDRVRLTSVVAESGQLLTRVALVVHVGDMRFLKFSLPDRKDTLWTALVDGKEVAVSRDGDLYCLPLEEQNGGQVTSVEFVYAGSAAGSPLGWGQKFVAPGFRLPMNDIGWTLYVPPEMKYYGFGGTMEPVARRWSLVKAFDADQYLERNRARREVSLEKARQVLDVGEELVRAGEQRRARKAFQEALTYSQGQADLNEDARVQLRNLVKQQVKMGLVNRRDAVRFSKNIIDEQQLGQMEGFREGDYTQEYVESVEQRLSAKDSDALERVADRIIEQQAAAAGVVTAIRITMPEYGKELGFARPLQIEPKDELSVAFKVGRGRVAALFKALWPSLFVFAGFWFAASRRTGR